MRTSRMPSYLYFLPWGQLIIGLIELFLNTSLETLYLFSNREFAITAMVTKFLDFTFKFCYRSFKIEKSMDWCICH